MNRKAMLQALHDNLENVWDIIIIGGGATGLGTAVDAASRGYKTLLIEQSDFAKGTSSRSTKLVHGGVRYLEKGDLGLVMEALVERGYMLKNAPHLTSDQEFVIPVYSWFDALMYTAGLTFYQLLAGRLGLGKSHFISRGEVLNRLPLLNADALKGGVVYHDGQFDDARMAVALAQTATEYGACVMNYFRVTELLKDIEGKLIGVRATDMVSGQIYNLRAKIIINATGVFADEIHRMDHPVAKPTIRPSQGIHLVLDHSFLKSSSAVMIPKTDDRRVLFAIPWYDKVVVGTTDTPVKDVSSEPVALPEEIDFILRTAGKYLLKQPSRRDVLAVFAGLRPLAATTDDSLKTKEISRRHKITISSSGLVTIVGGKWTTYRRMAKDVLDIALRKSELIYRKCVTLNLRVYGYDTRKNKDKFSPYGSFAAGVDMLIQSDPALGEAVHPRLPYVYAEFLWIIRNEMPVTLEDILARRTRALFLDARAAIEAAPRVAKFMASELKLDKVWEDEQVDHFTRLANDHYLIQS